MKHTMIGLWDRAWNRRTLNPNADTTTHQLGADYLTGLTVEDWGSGLKRFSTHHPNVTSVDGSGKPDIRVDLTTHTSTTPGLFMRHVLEHNHDWQAVLTNALASFTHRMFLVVFTPDSATTRVIASSPLGGGHMVPDIAFNPDDITNLITRTLPDATVRTYRLDTKTPYGGERVWEIEHANAYTDTDA